MTPQGLLLSDELNQAIKFVTPAASTHPGFRFAAGEAGVRLKYGFPLSRE